MKMKRLIAIGVAVAMILGTNMTVFAASWQQNNVGWWWQEDDGSWPSNTWRWLDGNNDGIAECYYFDGNGYMLANTTTPDGYQVDANGAWIVNNIVQTKAVGAIGGSGSSSNSAYDNGGYDSCGVSKAAMEMIGNSKEQNVKFGEVEVYEDSGGIDVHYANGFFIFYPKAGTGTYKFLSVSSKNSDVDKSHLFKLWKPGMSPDEAASYLHQNGFAKGMEGVYSNGTICYIAVNNRSLSWQSNSLQLR